MSSRESDGMESPLILSHPSPKGGEAQLHVFGPKDAKELVIMCAGFPDDHQGLSPLAKRMAKDCQCLVGVACLPGFQESYEFAKAPKNGFALQDWVASLRESTKALRSYSSRSLRETKLTAVYHDWGVMGGLAFSNQAIEDGLENLAPNRLIILDVLPSYHPKTPKKPSANDYAVESAALRALNNFRFVFYQGAIACTFLLHQYVAKPVAIAFCALATPVVGLIRAFPVGPGDSEYMQKSGLLDLSQFGAVIYKAYFYPRVIKAIFTGTIKSLFQGCWMPRDLTKTPVLFMYGGGKPYHLHSPKVEALLKKEEMTGGKSRIVEVKDAGHWLHVTKEDECMAEIQQFIV